MNFVKTSNEDTYKKLLELGFTFLQKEGNYYCFINDGKQVFDNENVIITNKLCM